MPSIRPISFNFEAQTNYLDFGSLQHLDAILQGVLITIALAS